MTSNGAVGQPAGGGREGQTFGGESLLVRYVNLVRLPHTVFALPFALVGVVLASRTASVSWQTFVLVALAFTAGDGLWSVEEPGVLRHWDAASGHQVAWHQLSEVETP